jgi:hypothetical protein
MIIWDEYKYGKEVYDASSTKTKKWQTNELRSLVKYLLTENKEITTADIRNELEKCCNDEIKYLTKKQKTNIFNKLILQCLDQNKELKIIKDKTVTIYKSEIEKIKSSNNKYMEQILFIMLVYSKWLELEWFSISKNDLKKESKVTTLNNNVLRNLLFEIFEKGYAKSEVKKVDRSESKKEKIKKKQMWKVIFLDTNGDIAFKFNNYDNFVFRYLNYVYGGYFECKECGGMFIQSKKNNKTKCNKCNAYHLQEAKITQCIDCGKDITVDARNNTKIRCNECYDIYRREYAKIKKREKRSKNRPLSTDDFKS